MNKTNTHKDEYSSILLRMINSKQNIDTTFLKKAFLNILKSKDVARDTQLGSVLTGMLVKGSTIDEAQAMIETVFKLDHYKFNNTDKTKVVLPNNARIIGLAGSGKKGFKTINISTPSGLIAATLGTYVVKSCSHSTSSMTGSSDFLQQIGVNINVTKNQTIKILQETHFGAFSIEDQIPNFDKVYGGKIHAPTVLSFALAGLLFPIHVDCLMYGLSYPAINMSAEVFKRFGFNNIFVYSTKVDEATFIDEIVPIGDVNYVNVNNGSQSRIVKFKYPSKQNYHTQSIEQGNNPIENVQKTINILTGKGDKSQEDTICWNAAAVLFMDKKCVSMMEGFKMAKEIIKTKAVIKKLFEIIEMSGGNKSLLQKFI